MSTSTIEKKALAAGIDFETVVSDLCFLRRDHK